MTIQTVLRRILIVGVFSALIVPFIVDKSLYFPFITGKAYAFRVLVEVMFAVWIGLIIIEPSARPKNSYILWSIVSFLVIVFIANLLGTNPEYSFWSNYERMEGYVTLLHLFGYFLIVSTVLNTKKIWDTFLNSFVVASVVQAFYAFLQAGGVFKVAMTSDRIDGTLGNATYLAAFMLSGVFLTFYLWMKGNRSKYLNFTYVAAIVIQITAIFLTGTRGTLIAVIGGLFLAVLLMAILEPKKKMLRWGVAGSLVAIILFVSLVFGFKESSLVQSSVALKRLSEISLDSGTVLARFINWGIAWEAVKEEPLLGYGQGNFGPIFDQNYDPRMWNQEQWFDRVHNLFFDWLIAAGFLGLISYLLIIASSLYYIWKSSSSFSNAMRASFTAFFAAYFVHVMFVFDSLTSYMVLFIIFAFIHYQVARPFKLLESFVFPKEIAKTLVFVAILGAPFLVWAVNADSYLQNKEIINAIIVKDIADIDKSRETFERALSRDTFGDQEALSQLLDFTGRVYRTEGVNEATKQSLVQLSFKEIEEYISERPNDSRVKLISGQFAALIGDFDLATKYFDDVVKISPNKQSLYQLPIEVLFQQGKNDEALALVKYVYEINTDNTNFWLLYVRSALRAGNTQLYNQLIEDAFETNRGDRVVQLSESTLQRNPENPQAYASLAVTYYRMRQDEKAIEVLNIMANKFPESKAQTDLIIQRIRSGENPF